MLKRICEQLDRIALWTASSSVSCSPDPRLAEAEARLREQDFQIDVGEPTDLVFLNRKDFQFSSPVRSSWPCNDVVRGRLYRCAESWVEHPTVILLHGWNGEYGYRWLFPYLAWRLNRIGINVAMIELPYHGQRKPRERGAIHNFLAGHLLHMIEASQQAVADTRALVAWLRAQGCPSVGLWGQSLGAWLSGVVASVDPQIRFVALLTPMARLDRALAELPFCRPIRESLKGQRKFRLDPLNLAKRPPLCGTENVLIVSALYDLFVPPETLMSLWVKRGTAPELWRLRHGHISILMALPVLEQIVKWVGKVSTANRAASPPAAYDATVHST